MAAVEEEWLFPLLLRPFSIAAAIEEQICVLFSIAAIKLHLHFCIVNFCRLLVTRRGAIAAGAPQLERFYTVPV